MEERHRGNSLALLLLQLVTSTAVPLDDVSLNAAETVTLTAATAIATVEEPQVHRHFGRIRRAEDGKHVVVVKEEASGMEGICWWSCGDPRDPAASD